MEPSVILLALLGALAMFGAAGGGGGGGAGSPDDPGPLDRTTTNVFEDFQQGADKLNLSLAYLDYAAARADARDLGDGSGLYFAAVNTTVLGLTLGNFTQAATTFP